MSLKVTKPGIQTLSTINYFLTSLFGTFENDHLWLRGMNTTCQATSCTKNEKTNKKHKQAKLGRDGLQTEFSYFSWKGEIQYISLEEQKQLR